MRIESARYEGGALILTTNDAAARQFAYLFKPGEYSIRHTTKKRSLDANAYAWVLIDKLSEAIGLPKMDVYRNTIRDIGGVSDVLCVQENAADAFRTAWESNGLGWQTEIMPSKLPGCVNVVVFYGSSSYDSKQMSRLIDHLVQDCQAVGIETMAPEALASLLGEWDAKKK